MLDDHILSVLRGVEWSQILSNVQENPSQVTDRTLQLVIGVSAGDFGSLPGSPVPVKVIKAILEAKIVKSNQPSSVLRTALHVSDITVDVFHTLLHYKYCWWLPTYLPGFDFAIAERQFLNDALQIHYRDSRRMDWSREKLDILMNRFPFALDIILSGALKCHQNLRNIQKILAKAFEQGHNQLRYLLSLRWCSIGSSPLEVMVQFGRYDIIQFLSQNIPVLLEKNYIFTFNLLHALVRNMPYSKLSLGSGMLESHLADYLTLARMIIDLYPEALGKIDEYDCLPIHYVCQFATITYSPIQLSLLKLFIEKGQEQNVGGNHGRGGLLVANEDEQVPLESLIVSYISSQDLRAILLDPGRPPLLQKGDSCTFQLLLNILQTKSDRKDLREKTLMLVDLDPDLLSKQDTLGNLPLHYSVLSCTDEAIFESSPTILVGNINQNNENFTLLDGDENNAGLRALHFDFLLERGVRALVGGKNGFGGLLIPNNDGNTSLSLIIQFCDVTYKYKEKAIFSLRNMQALACIKSCWDRFQNKLPLLHFVFRLSSCDTLMITTIITFHKDYLYACDDAGDTPLHTLLKQYERMKDRRFNSLTYRSKGTDRLDRGIEMVLTQDENAPSKCDKDGRLPLHVALENYSLTWPNIISKLISHSQRDITTCDPVTGLYPYQLAASSKVQGDNLSCIYELLRRAPDQIINFIGGEDSNTTMGIKRKADHLN